ncbi:hypothetical protein [Mycobacteroides franklinii]|uniref:hypothetical protein n=1 Tax=Mycobacteroides franklinii TaxID=948102 RepID=UPI001F289762
MTAAAPGNTKTVNQLLSVDTPDVLQRADAFAAQNRWDSEGGAQDVEHRVSLKS